jgi:hypothetical protein
MAKFTKDHAKEALPDGSDVQHDTWVKTANKADGDGKTEAAAKDLATKVAKNVKEAGSRASVMLLLAEVGKVLSSANEDKVRTAHGHLEDVLGSLKSDKPAATTEAGRARSLELMGLQESGSESADDAARGAWVLAELLRIMGDEADEPDQLAQLQTVYDGMAEWVREEAAEIGTDADEPADLGPYYGWEAKGIDIRHPSVIPLQESASAPLAEKTLLQEAVVRSNGTIPVKLIAPGWGVSGYYSEALLRACEGEVFTAGTQMYWDHPTKTEETDRPERSLRDLAGKLVTDAAYDPVGPKGPDGKPKGPGLYADALVYEAFQPAVNELGGDIGVSIRAFGSGHRGEAEGRSGILVDDFTEVASTDFVTIPGAGGEILPLFEAARARAREAQTTHPTTPTEDPNVDPVALKEAQDAAKASADRAARAEERLLQRDAVDIITAEVAKPEVKLPQITRDRLVHNLSEAAPPLTEKDGERELDKAKLVESIQAAVKDEQAYLESLASANGAGRVRGFGSTEAEGEVSTEQTETELTEAFADLGLSEAGAKLAAAGRR